MDDDSDPLASRSVVGTAQLALWIFICVCLWVGSIISVLMRPGIDGVMGLVVSALFSGWVWVTFFKHGDF